MKKTIVIEVLLLFILAVIISVIVPYMKQAITWFGDIKWYIERGETPHYLAYQYAHTGLIYSIFALLAAIVDLVVMFLIAARDIPKLKQAIEARKQRAAARKTAKAEADKQKRIEELQAELDDLNATKKNDLPPSE